MNVLLPVLDGTNLLQSLFTKLIGLKQRQQDKTREKREKCLTQDQDRPTNTGIKILLLIPKNYDAEGKKKVYS